MESGKLLFLFIVSIVIFGFVLRVSLIYGALRFMAGADRTVLMGRKLKIVAEEDREGMWLWCGIFWGILLFMRLF